MADPTYKEKRKASAAAPSRSRRVRTQTQAFTFGASHKVRSRTDRQVVNTFREEVDDETCCPPACPPTTPAEVSPSPAATLADATGTHIGLPRASLLGWLGRAAPVAEPVQDLAPRPTSTVRHILVGGGFPPRLGTPLNVAGVVGVCYAGCGTAWAGCYAAAGLVAGTIVASPAPAAASLCNLPRGSA